MKKQILVLCISCLAIFAACNNVPETSVEDIDTPEAGTVSIDTADVLVNPVLTQEQQNALTPGDVLNMLMKGNEEFVDDQLTVRNNTARVRAASMSQFPKAVILSCLDSRVPVEDVFHRGIGDIFVARVAGNIVNDDILGSMEFGCKVSGAKVIMVLGHEHCGAIKSAIDDVKLGNITALLAKIRPAVSITAYTGDKSSKNDAYVHEVCEENIRLTIEKIRKNSPILAEMEKNKDLIITGAVYDMSTGKVTPVQ
ncbi:carbonic anhydrase family protein [Chitinophaga sp. Cy-1792]|uniref:carbonic anhydrase family protein n=1 Tax=Chitinophaga sp. Cy-1792 TaxID=2608339 RepID=UPI0014200B1F|nr:carbonic anhydrase family protein [Chitinophaga sp. Cy-1792]NIG53463.1 carbonic anhydrase [Chitinophaga sp. Cy-1792]